jgi:hypothetical protein
MSGMDGCGWSTVCGMGSEEQTVYVIDENDENDGARQANPKPHAPPHRWCRFRRKQAATAVLSSRFVLPPSALLVSSVTELCCKLRSNSRTNSVTTTRERATGYLQS